MIIIIDTFPASSVAKRGGKVRSLLDECRDWIEECEAAGHTILVPAVVYYEVLRELELRNASSQVERLRTFCLQPERFMPLVTAHLEVAARLWAGARRSGLPTAAPQALDVDVTLAAQVLGLELDPDAYVVATTNPNHLSRFVSCRDWSTIRP